MLERAAAAAMGGVAWVDEWVGGTCSLAWEVGGLGWPAGGRTCGEEGQGEG